MMLPRLRKIEALTIKITEDMSIHYDFETDTLYLRGEERGIEKERTERVIKFWKKGIDNAMISNLMDMSINQVEQIIAQYQQEKIII
jgi:hypothetical protein